MHALAPDVLSLQESVVSRSGRPRPATETGYCDLREAFSRRIWRRTTRVCRTAPTNGAKYIRGACRAARRTSPHTSRHTAIISAPCSFGASQATGEPARVKSRARPESNERPTAGPLWSPVRRAKLARKRCSQRRLDQAGVYGSEKPRGCPDAPGSTKRALRQDARHKATCPMP